VAGSCAFTTTLRDSLTMGDSASLARRPPGGYGDAANQAWTRRLPVPRVRAPAAGAVGYDSASRHRGAP